MKELVASLLVWISANTPLAWQPGHAPQVMQVSRAEIVRTAFEGRLPRGMNFSRLKIVGLYQFRERNVYMVDTLDLDTVRGRAALVHELVHYLQYQAGTHEQVACKNELEPTAYAAQALYLAQNGVDPGFTSHHVESVSTCPW